MSKPKKHPAPVLPMADDAFTALLWSVRVGAGCIVVNVGNAAPLRLTPYQAGLLAGALCKAAREMESAK